MANYRPIGDGTMSSANCKYEWKIHNFHSYNAKDSMYRSAIFYVSNSTWFIKISPNGCGDKDPDKDSTGYVSLYLHKNSGQESGTINFSFGFKADNNIVVNVRKAHFEGPSLGWPMFMKKSELLRRKSDLLPLGILTIVCVIEVEGSSPDLLADHSSLAEDFKNLFHYKENSDVTLKVKEKAFLAHQVILAARSPVFDAMFKNEMTEKKTRVVNISDCDVKAFNVFLLFLYSGELDFANCNVCHLYKISDKYDVQKLKLMCIEFMAKNLSVENFYDILILSDQFTESKLLTDIQSFFNKNFEAIVSSKKWESFSINHLRLANNLLRKMAPKVKIVE